MSISNLLDPETKNQEWSKLYCNGIEALEITADNLASNSYEENVFQYTDINPASGTSALVISGAVKSIVERTFKQNQKWITLSLGFSVNFQDGIPIGGATQTACTLILDLPHDIRYPPNTTSQLMTGTAQASGKSDFAGNPYIAVQVELLRDPNPSKLVMIFYIDEIVSTGTQDVFCNVGLKTTYRIV
jgi:hypothetical protein